MFVCVQYNEEMGQSPPVNDASFTPHNQPSLPRFNGQVSYVVCVVCLSIRASSSLYAGVRIWLSLTDCYRQTCVSCSRAGIVFTYWSKNCFFALLGRHVAPINVKYWRSGAGHSFSMDPLDFPSRANFYQNWHFWQFWGPWAHIFNATMQKVGVIVGTWDCLPCQIL